MNSTTWHQFRAAFLKAVKECRYWHAKRIDMICLYETGSRCELRETNDKYLPRLNVYKKGA